MRHFGRRATQVLRRPGAFALVVLKGFRANQGVLLAGAVAYYTLLSLVPLLILVLIVLSHLFSEDQLLLTLQEYLGFIVPGQANITGVHDESPSCSERCRRHPRVL